MEKKSDKNDNMLLKPPPDYSTPSLKLTLKASAQSPRRADPPPAYAPPSAYTVGAQKLTAPLVHVHQLKAHLALLRAFKSLRLRVEDENNSEWPGPKLGSAAQRWAYFVGVAVERCGTITVSRTRADQ